MSGWLRIVFVGSLTLNVLVIGAVVGLTTLAQMSPGRDGTAPGRRAAPMAFEFVRGLDREFVITRAWEEATGAEPSTFP